MIRKKESSFSEEKEAKRLLFLGRVRLESFMRLRLGLALVLWAPCALAQTDTGARPGNDIGTGMSLPRSDKASNINAATAGSTLAPNLPAPPASEDTQTLLLYARQALREGRTGEAQEALERAETRALDRSVVAGTQNVPASGPLISATAAARQAIAAGNNPGAIKIIDDALPSAAAADLPR